MRKHLCVLASDFPSEGRPVYVFVEQLVNALVDLGVQVSVVAPQNPIKVLFGKTTAFPQKQTNETPNGNKYVVYRPHQLSFGNGKKWLYRIAEKYNKRSLCSCVKEINPDILYGHFWHNANKLKHFAISNHKPLFVACGEGDNALEELLESLSSQEKKDLTNAVKGVISVSTENKRKCLEYGLAKEKDIIVLPNAADKSMFHPMSKNYQLRQELNVGDDDFLLLFVGGFVHRKGCGILAKAIDKLADEHVKVIFAGAPLRGDEDDPVCKGIVYKGTISHNVLPSYFAAADAFVLPTQKEGCSNAIVEALAMGIPVISSIGAFNDDILNETNSIRVNPLDVNEVSDAILRLKNDSKLYEAIKNNAIEQSGQHSIALRANKIVQFLKRQVEKE